MGLVLLGMLKALLRVFFFMSLSNRFTIVAFFREMEELYFEVCFLVFVALILSRQMM